MENETPSAKTGNTFGPKTAIVLVCVVSVGVALAVTGQNRKQCGCIPPDTEAAPQQTAPPEAVSRTARPRLVDLGAGTCIPCKRMAPILDELKEEYAGRFDVEFIDVWKNRDAGRQYGIQGIPTQIFFDADGTELYRHQGFFAKQEILDKWKELGIALTD